MRLVSLSVLALFVTVARAEQEPIVIAPDGRSFQFANSGARFVPWGHNYQAGDKLLDDVWDADWNRVAGDFREMRDLGANVVRVHLQLARFMDTAVAPNAQSLKHLKKLLSLAEELGIYLDVTGLGCYRTADVPKWYDELSTTERWRVQARFWSAIADTCAGSPAVFCYDLMNEPVIPGGKRAPGDWYSGKPLGGYDFVQFITLDPPDRPRDEIGREWIQTLARAIREKDRRHLVTVGLLPWTKKWGHLSGFLPEKLPPEIDFVSVHVYPESGQHDEAMEVLKKFAVGRPLVVEETFNLRCGPDELKRFLLESRHLACGWMGHYAGDSIAEMETIERAGKLTLPQAIYRQWLRLFQSQGTAMREAPPAGN